MTFAQPLRHAIRALLKDRGTTLHRPGADSQVPGRSIEVNGRAFTIVGVAPRDFDGVMPGGSASQVWIPSAMFRVGYRYCDAFARDCTVVDVIGRLKASATIQQA
jgi:hypothetical protein